MRYRSVLYSQYFTNQSGRAHTATQDQKFQSEKKQFAREILPLIPSDKSIRILDLGCGIGSLLAALKEDQFLNVKGIDVSPEQVEIAHAFGIPEVECIDIRDFFMREQLAFDLICGMDIIEHFTKDELVDLLQLIRTHLKPGGIVIFRTPNADAPSGSIFAQGDFTHETILNANSSEQLLMAVGFQDIRVLPAHIEVQGLIREVLRKAMWTCYLGFQKLLLFSSGRSSKQVVFTPNLILMGRRV
ncbi:MAG TPA: class I SAM-dependent methyltransferase [Saprospiraceae bacterium]|nr:class I SAM-dependent methyltransferase [Saprospiraceae bacterium]